MVPLANDKNAFLIVIAGSLSSGEDAARAQQTVVYAPAVFGDAGHSVLSLAAGFEGARAVLFAGVPLREPIVPYGPFVGNSRQDIAGYAQAFQSGAMGTLEASFSR